MKRTVTRVAVVTATAGAIGAALATPAFANYGWGGTLRTNDVACVGQQANYQVRGEGTATRSGAKFRIYKDGVRVAASNGPSVNAWAAELRPGLFPGGGFYTVCAENPNVTNTLVNIRILVDGEF